MKITSRSLARASTLFVALAAASAACLAGPVAGATPAQSVASGISTHTLTGASAAEIANYWTPERMRDAIDADALAPAGSAPTSRAGGSGSGPATMLARPQAPLTNRPQAAPTNGLQATTTTTPTRSPTGNPAQGKLFFYDRYRGNGSCSAGTVNNPTKNMVFTAAHCLWDWPPNGGAGYWMTQVMFAPAYYNGATPYGKWSLSHGAVWDQFSVNKNYNYDYGVVNVYPDAAGRRLVDQVGGNGLSYNAGYSVTVTVWGYPKSYLSSGPYDGETPYYCSNVPTSQHGSRIKTTCDMPGGSSGGSWLLFYNASTRLGNINGVTSQRDPNLPAGYVVSPYFDNNVATLYDIRKNL
jgi:V8-like Glu-specific endopeptidase